MPGAVRHRHLVEVERTEAFGAGDVSLERHGAAVQLATSDGTTAPHSRWRLHRAGIVNVCRYEDGALHFGGGLLPHLNPM